MLCQGPGLTWRQDLNSLRGTEGIVAIGMGACEIRRNQKTCSGPEDGRDSHGQKGCSQGRLGIAPSGWLRVGAYAKQEGAGGKHDRSTEGQPDAHCFQGSWTILQLDSEEVLFVGNGPLGQNGIPVSIGLPTSGYVDGNIIRSLFMSGL